jgi:hypothetical protein
MQLFKCNFMYCFTAADEFLPTCLTQWCVLLLFHMQAQPIFTAMMQLLQHPTHDLFVLACMDVSVSGEGYANSKRCHASVMSCCFEAIVSACA